MNGYKKSDICMYIRSSRDKVLCRDSDYLLGQCGEAILIFVGTVWRGYSYFCWDSVARLFLYSLRLFTGAYLSTKGDDVVCN